MSPKTQVAQFFGRTYEEEITFAVFKLTLIHYNCSCYKY